MDGSQDQKQHAFQLFLPPTRQTQQSRRDLKHGELCQVHQQPEEFYPRRQDKEKMLIGACPTTSDLSTEGRKAALSLTLAHVLSKSLEFFNSTFFCSTDLDSIAYNLDSRQDN